MKRSMVERGQGDAIVAVILASAALLLGVALWNLFASSISSVAPSMNIVNALAYERVNLQVVKLIDDEESNRKVLVYQISRLDYERRKIFVIVVGVRKSNYVYIDPSTVNAYAMPSSPLLCVFSNLWNPLPSKEIYASRILVESVLGTTRFVELSTWIGSIYVKSFVLDFDGSPIALKIVIDTSTLQNIDSIAVMFGIYVNGNIYVVSMDTTNI